MMGAGDHVRALEPATNHEMPRATLRERGQLKMLAPGEEVNYRLEEEIHNISMCVFGGQRQRQKRVVRGLPRPHAVEAEGLHSSHCFRDLFEIQVGKLHIEFHLSPNNLSAVSRRICRFDSSDSGRL